ncbi:MAG: hypothetical protein ABI721_05605 [Candidatus Dojkabacteria bacterium]
MFRNLKNLIQSHKLADSYSADTSIFKDLEIGCSFDPFHHVFKEKGINPISALKYLHTELKIQNIRLSIKWSEVYKNEIFDFSYYKKYFDYCFSHNLKVVLNVGPIKTMRWPEEHIPEQFKALVNKRDTITLDHPIANAALKYLEELLKYIKKEYSKNLKNIIAIQGDNECFNRFGQYEVFVSTEFEKEVLKIIKTHFKDTTIFINSAALNDFKSIFKTIQDINSEFILGVNYYYKVPYQNRIPFINKMDGTIILNKPFTMSPEHLKKIASRKNYEIEISELQGEPWGESVQSPGSDFTEFVFTLYRSLYLKPDSQRKMMVRYWGIEDLAVKFLNKTANSENEKIKNLIAEINSN